MNKSISILPLVSLQFQSCVIFQKTSVTPYKAYGSGRVKVENNNGTIKRYKNIKLLNGVYHGVMGKL